MGCCDSKIKAVAGIARGNAGHVAELFRLPSNKCPATDRRTRICQQCEKSTWLTFAEFYGWLKSQGVTKVIRHIDELETLPELPKQEYKKGTKLFCMICKCFIPAKVRDEDNYCFIGKW